MSPWRIAHITATFPPYHGGTGNVCYHNARELARRGHEVIVFTAALPGAPAHEQRDGFSVRRLRPLLRVGNAPLLPGLVTELRGFDLVHLHYPFLLGGELTTLASMLWHIPLVATYHNDLIRDGSWRDHVFQLFTWLSRYTTLSYAQRICFVSQGHAEQCEQRVMYQRRRAYCRVLPNGVDTALFSPASDTWQTREKLGLPLHTRVIGFVGGLDRAHHYKGLGMLLQALARPQLTNYHLLVVGDGELREDYYSTARQLGVVNRVIFAGAVAHTLLPPYYRACDVIAMPSLATESFGLVLIEALACGVPVVASDGPGVRSVVEHGSDGLLIPAGDVIALETALAMLLENESSRQFMGLRGHQRITTYYDWRRIGDELVAIYEVLLAGMKTTTSLKV